VARPNTKYPSHEIADWEWTHTTDSGGHLDSGQIRSACLLTIAKRLSRTNGLLEQLHRDLLTLGVDGIHDILRITARKMRTAERLRKAKIAAKRRRTIAAKKAAQQG
jgi:hypothetical protein